MVESGKDHALSLVAKARGWKNSDAWVGAGLVLLALLVRCVVLELKPPHFDEGINGWFVDRMKETGFFSYDPNNYHGPLHFYILYLSETLFGRNLIALRLPVVLIGATSVGVLLAYGKYYGQKVARLAALAMALSPGYVFYSRYSIHESWLVFFNLIFFLGFLRLWKEGGKEGLFLLVGGMTGMILTKETYLIQGFSLGLAWMCFWVWGKVVPVQEKLPWATQKWSWQDLGASIAAASFAIVFFYSGTFYHPSGLHGLWQTLVAWVQTGTGDGGHEKEAFALFGGPLNWYWVSLFLRYEWMAMGGLLACFWCLGRVDARVRLTAIYGSGLLLAYSLVPYKTPWCIISFLWPFYLVFAAFVFSFSGRVRMVLLGIAIVLMGGGLWTSTRLTFWDYDNEKEPYVYVQTYRDIEKLTGPLLAAAETDPSSYGLRGEILTESYYPLPWILGDFYNIGYFGADKWPEVFRGDFVIADEVKREEIRGKLQGDYEEVTFRLRDAQEPCVVFFRRGVFPK